MHRLVERLNAAAVTVVFSGLKKQVLDVMRATGLVGLITQANIHATADHALAYIYEHSGDQHGSDAMRPLATLPTT